MSFSEKIKNLGEYFVTSSIAEGALCVVTKFPSEWIMPDEKVLKEQYKIESETVDGLVYFMTEIDNGEDNIFSAIDNIIQSNRELEDKKKLLYTKVNELKEIFATEPLEKLQTLAFVFDKKFKGLKKKTKIETDTDEEIKYNIAEVIKNKRTKLNNEKSDAVNSVTETSKTETSKQMQDEPSSLVNLALSMANN